MSTLAGLTEIWLSVLTTRGCSSNTIDLYKRNMREFSQFLAKTANTKDVQIESISRDLIILALSNYRESNDKRTNKVVTRSTQSVMSYYTTLKSFLNCATKARKSLLTL
jgi:hypothetical protein